MKFGGRATGPVCRRAARLVLALAGGVWAACAPASIPAASPSPGATAHPTFEARPSASPAPTFTPSPPPTAPPSPPVTPTVAEATSEALSPLAEILLTPEEVYSEIAISPDTLVDWEYTLEGLEIDCLGDCARLIMRTLSRDMTQVSLLLMRVGDPEDAEQTAANLFDDVLAAARRDPIAGGSTHIYTQSEIRRLRDAPPNTWIIDRTLREIVVGTSHGPVVLLMNWAYDFCSTLEDGTRYCEGDVWNVAVMALDVALLQLARLPEAG